MIAIIDYGLGNVRAFANVYKELNVPVIMARQAKDLERASRMILPGVGAFDYAMQRLEESGMRQILDELVLNRQMPVLGICVGMQLLANSSEEGSLPGLGWIEGGVRKFNPTSKKVTMRIPHMGWNDVKPIKTNCLLQGLDLDARFYFLHSYYFQSYKDEDTIAITDYYGAFASAINSENVYGVQFHPEKSHQWGNRLLENFAKL